MQLIRRHEKTAEDVDGNKIDHPTKEGMQKDYERGRELRLNYPDYQVLAYASQSERTRIGCESLLKGMNYSTTINQDEALNVVEVPEDVRNIKGDRFKPLFGLCLEGITQGGKNLARYLVQHVSEYISEESDTNTLQLYKSHLPTMTPAYLALLGENITYENAILHTTEFPEGEGFDMRTEKIGSVWNVTLSCVDNTYEIELPELLERVK
jgi:hypothetical protein